MAVMKYPTKDADSADHLRPTKCLGYEVEDIIAMAREIERGGYDPNSEDWNAYKAGYSQGHRIGYAKGRFDEMMEKVKR